MTADTESRLRAAFRAGAEAMDAPLPPLDLSAADPSARAVRWRPVAAVAAAVAATVGIALAVRDTGTPQGPADGPSTNPTSTPTSAPPPVTDGLRGPTCTASNGGAWATSLTTVRPADVAAPTAGSLSLYGVAADGTVVAGQRGAPDRVLLVHPDGSARVAVTLSAELGPGDPLRLGGFEHGQVEGHWALYTEIVGGGQGSTLGILALDTVTGSVVTVRRATTGDPAIVQPPVLHAGTVYWSEGDQYGRDRAYAFGLDGRRRTTLAKGQDVFVFGLAGGVYVSEGKRVVTVVPGQLPAGYQLDAKAYQHPVVTGGAGRSWVRVAGGELELVLRHATQTLVIARVPIDSGSLTPLALTSTQLVWSDASTLRVLDLRTGAVAVLPSTGLANGAAVAGGTLAVQTQAGRSGSMLLRVGRVSGLPELRC